MLGVGLGAIIRNQVGAIIGALVYLLLLEGLIGLVPGIRDVLPKYGLGGTSQALRATDAGDPDTDFLAQLPGGLLLAGYVAVFADRRDRRDAATATSRPDAPAARDGCGRRGATALIIAVDIDQVGEADYSHEALLDEWGEVDFELAKDAVVARGRRRHRRSPTRTSAAATCSRSSTRSARVRARGRRCWSGPSAAGARRA